MSAHQGYETIHGPVYTALLKSSDVFGARPYLHALVRGPPSGPAGKSDLSYQRFTAYARSEGKLIFAPKVLGKGESRPFVDLVWDLDASVVKYWGDVELEHGDFAKNMPRPVVLEGIWSFESFLLFAFSQGVLVDPEHARVLEESGHPLPHDPTVDLTGEDGGQDYVQQQPFDLHDAELVRLEDHLEEGDELGNEGQYEDRYAHPFSPSPPHAPGPAPGPFSPARQAAEYSPVSAEGADLVVERVDIVAAAISAIDGPQVDAVIALVEEEVAARGEDGSHEAKVLKEMAALLKRQRTKINGLTKMMEDLIKRNEFLELLDKEKTAASTVEMVASMLPKMISAIVKQVKEALDKNGDENKSSLVTSLEVLLADGMRPIHNLQEVLLGGLDTLHKKVDVAFGGAGAGTGGAVPPLNGAPPTLAVAPPAPRVQRPAPIRLPGPPPPMVPPPSLQRGLGLGLGLIRAAPTGGFSAPRVVDGYGQDAGTGGAWAPPSPASTPPPVPGYGGMLGPRVEPSPSGSTGRGRGRGVLRSLGHVQQGPRGSLQGQPPAAILNQHPGARFQQPGVGYQHPLVVLQQPAYGLQQQPAYGQQQPAYGQQQQAGGDVQQQQLPNFGLQQQAGEGLHQAVVGGQQPGIGGQQPGDELQDVQQQGAAPIINWGPNSKRHRGQ